MSHSPIARFPFRLCAVLALGLASCQAAPGTAAIDPLPDRSGPPADPTDFSDLYDSEPREQAIGDPRERKRYRITILLDHELALSAGQKEKLRKELDGDLLRKETWLAGFESGLAFTRPIPAIDIEGTSDANTILGKLDVITLASIMEMLEPAQTERYADLMGTFGMREIRQLTRRREEARRRLGGQAVAFDKGVQSPGTVDNFLGAWDRNGNGVIEPNELPWHLRQNFGRYDTNGDGVLDLEECMGFKDFFEGRLVEPYRRGSDIRMIGEEARFNRP